MRAISSFLESFSFTSFPLLFLMLPLIAVIGFQLSNRKKHGTIVLNGLEYVRGKTGICVSRRRVIGAVLWGVIVVVLGVLWAGPVFHSPTPIFGTAEQMVYKNFLVVFDVSPSMTVPVNETREISRPGPAFRQVVVTVKKGEGRTRYEAAREALVDFVERFEGERIGLILFSTEPFLARWPTTETANHFLEVLEENIGRGERSQLQVFSSLTNTDLALDLARQIFHQQEAVEGGAVILIADAEDDVENMSGAARQLRGDGIRLYTIGVGISEKVVDSLSREFADDPGFRIFRVDSEEEMAEAYRLVAEVEESPLFSIGEREFETDLRWILSLALGVIAGMIFWVLEVAFHQSQIADLDRGSRERRRHGLRFS